MSLDNDPRKVGGVYRDGYWGDMYEVLGFVEHDDWRSRSIRVRWDVQCGLHPEGCALTREGRMGEHSTAWEPRWDRVISEPA